MRASSPRFVSWVAVVESPAGHRESRCAFRAWNVEGGLPNRDGVAADLVHGHERDVAIERRVFQALRLHRAGRLLEADREPLPELARPGFEPLGELQQQDVSDEAEDRLVDGGLAAPGAGDRPLDLHAIRLGRGIAGLDVGPIDAEAGHHLAERAGEVVQREVAGPPVLLGDPVEQPGQHGQLAGQRASAR